MKKLLSATLISLVLAGCEKTQLQLQSKLSHKLYHNRKMLKRK